MEAVISDEAALSVGNGQGKILLIRFLLNAEEKLEILIEVLYIFGMFLGDFRATLGLFPGYFRANFGLLQPYFRASSALFSGYCRTIFGLL